jgi:hypothetical protein
MNKIDSLLIKHSKYENPFLNNIAKYIIANVHLNLFIKEGNSDPMKMVNNFLEKWYYGESIQSQNPYYITTFSYLLSTLCNLKAYQISDKVECNPVDIEGIEYLAKEINNKKYSDLARFFLTFQALMIDMQKGREIAKKYASSIESEELKNYFKKLIE